MSVLQEASRLSSIFPHRVLGEPELETPLPIKQVAIAAFEITQEVTKMVNEFKSRREFRYTAVKDIEGIELYAPGRAF